MANGTRSTVLVAGLFVAGVTTLVSFVACTSSLSAGCPPVPLHCAPGYVFSDQTCGCESVPCKVNADCASAGVSACDTEAGICGDPRKLPVCAPTFLCEDTIKPGGTCDCHADCQCDPSNTSGKGATFCLGLGGTCMERCTDQPDPAQFCGCISSSYACAPNGQCVPTCNDQKKCQSGTCTNGFCIEPLNPSINTEPCSSSDAGTSDAADAHD